MLLAGFRPEKRVAAASLSLPLASVSIAALTHENWFNGAVFAALSMVLAVLASRASNARVALGSRWAALLGSLLIAFGWVYPHFLEGVPWSAFLYGAPLGVIPCPTLSVVVGAALLAGGFGVGAWRLVLCSTALLYSLFGMFRLGVLLDAGLLIGAVGLMWQHVQDSPRRSRRGDAPARLETPAGRALAESRR